jgi:hypothetical protein
MNTKREIIYFKKIVKMKFNANARSRGKSYEEF